MCIYVPTNHTTESVARSLRGVLEKKGGCDDEVAALKARHEVG